MYFFILYYAFIQLLIQIITLIEQIGRVEDILITKKTLLQITGHDILKCCPADHYCRSLSPFRCKAVSIWTFGQLTGHLDNLLIIIWFEKQRKLTDCVYILTSVPLNGKIMHRTKRNKIILIHLPINTSALFKVH